MGAYAVYTDNYYGSLELAQDTAKRGFEFTFNCRANRPSWLFQNGTHKTLHQIGEVPQMECYIHKTENYAAVTFKDKACVNFLTNMATAETVVIQQRQNKAEEKTPKHVPLVAKDYSQGGMGHVDTFDAALSRFKDHRNISWRRTHFLTMMKLSVVNAWVVYCSLLRKRGEVQQADKLSLGDFFELLKVDLAKQMEENSRTEDDEKKKATRKRKAAWMREHRKNEEKSSRAFDTTALGTSTKRRKHREVSFYTDQGYYPRIHAQIKGGRSSYRCGPDPVVKGLKIVTGSSQAS
jgi:hypothetical protein